VEGSASGVVYGKAIFKGDEALKAIKVGSEILSPLKIEKFHV
jgi:hypothetical protein